MYALYLHIYGICSYIYLRLHAYVHNMKSPHTRTIHTLQPYEKLGGNKEMDALSSRSVLIMATPQGAREVYLGLF